MLELLKTLFAYKEFIPHGHCFLWKPELVSLHIVSNCLIALAYYSIPITLFHFVRKRQDLPFNGIFLLFGGFIIACGTNHIMDILTLWYPTYWLSGFTKAITALISLYTAFELVPLVPKALALPSSAQLEAANEELKREISERMRMEEALKESQAKYKTLFEILPIGISITDEVGNLVEANPAFEKILEISTTEYTTLRYSAPEKVIIRPDGTPMSPEEFASVRALAENRVVENIETGYLKANGEITWISVTAAPIPLPGYGVAIAYIDITCRKLATALRESEERFRRAFDDAAIAQEALQQALLAAQAASIAKSQFLSHMSHELRTPLNAILGFSQLLARSNSLSPDEQEQLKIINRSGEHLLGLINDILSMSKIEAGQVTLHKYRFDLYQLLCELEQMLQLKATAKNLQLIFERAADIPQYVETDEGKLRQVLINLLGNAIKFTKSGSVTLRVSLVQHKKPMLNDTQQMTIQFAVEDTGPGISPDEMDTLFDPFVQTETSDRSMQGTGLGLPISRHFVQLMGGDIAVNSTRGKGTIFTFDVLLNQATAADRKKASTTSQVIGLQPNQPTYRILVVEDVEDNRLLLVKLLEPLGFQVRQAVNGTEAVALWSSWEPHLIWMDMQMPLIDGYEATRQIKATPKGKDTVIIALTASAFEEERSKIFSAGCDDFISKPFQQSVLFDKISEHLGVRYIYEDKNQLPLQSATLPRKLTAEDLNVMPPDWQAKLYQAALCLDDELVLHLIEEIPENEAFLAHALTDLVQNFRLDLLLTFT
ncbi:hypothetical protein NUACC21_77350 [Scytonema sp. NUACC21]